MNICTSISKNEVLIYLVKMVSLKHENILVVNTEIIIVITIRFPVLLQEFKTKNIIIINTFLLDI